MDINRQALESINKRLSANLTPEEVNTLNAEELIQVNFLIGDIFESSGLLYNWFEIARNRAKQVSTS